VPALVTTAATLPAARRTAEDPDRTSTGPRAGPGPNLRSTRAARRRGV